jgi:hypothetical protein
MKNRFIRLICIFFVFSATTFADDLILYRQNVDSQNLKAPIFYLSAKLTQFLGRFNPRIGPRPTPCSPACPTRLSISVIFPVSDLVASARIINVPKRFFGNTKRYLFIDVMKMNTVPITDRFSLNLASISKTNLAKMRNLRLTFRLSSKQSNFNKGVLTYNLISVK